MHTPLTPTPESNSNAKGHKPPNHTASYTSTLHVLIHKIQQLQCMGRPCIRGIDDVILNANANPTTSTRQSKSFADTVHLCGIQPPQYFWYMISGSICDIVQFIIDLAVHHILKINDPSICWAVSFSLSITARHSSHRWLVFGAYQGGYWHSLMRMYAGYSIIIVLSTLFNLYMTKVLLVPHYVAWVLTLLWTGVVNYFILKRLWSFGDTNNAAIGKKKVRSSRDLDLEDGTCTATGESSSGMVSLVNMR